MSSKPEQPRRIRRVTDWLQVVAHRSVRANDALAFADLTLDRATREVSRDGRRIDLTPIEFALLELFLANPQRVLTRSEILTSVWGFDFGTTSNTLNVYIGYLRRKTEAGGERRLIQTVRGVGYVLRDESAS
ncbi:MAG TPA: winged helix-turn-helix domain-containing protein [Gaiellaceae bacterium]|nr:winged helix-turn-helix domain-containing protein [Gaiellaceae bacterium]